MKVGAFFSLLETSNEDPAVACCGSPQQMLPVKSPQATCEDFSNDPMMPGAGGELIRGFLDAFGTHVRTHVR